MASLHPFRALRPAPPVAAPSPPFPTMSSAPKRRGSSPPAIRLSFLHVTRSEIDLPPGTDPYASSVYEKARENLASLRATAPLVVEESPSLYFYRLRMGGARTDRHRRLLLGRRVRARRHQEARAHAARQGRRSHAAHRRAPRADRRRVPDLSRRRRPSTRRQREVTAGAPLYDFTAPRRRAAHDLAGRRAADARGWSTPSRAIPALYIADGHHRAASAARARAELQTQVGGDAADAETFIAVAFPHDQMQILPTTARSRISRAARPSSSSRRCAKRFRSPKARRRRAQGRGRDVPRRPLVRASTCRAPRRRTTRARAASTSRSCSSTCSSRCCGIGDIRTDKRIDFVGGARGTAASSSAVIRARRRSRSRCTRSRSTT